MNLLLPQLPLYRPINFATSSLDEFSPVYHTTYELKLNRKYEEIKAGYTENHRRNIEKAVSLNTKIIENIPPERFLNLLLNDAYPSVAVTALGVATTPPKEILIETVAISTAFPSASTILTSVFMYLLDPLELVEADISFT